MDENLKIIKQIEEQLAIANELGTDFISLTVGTGKKIIDNIKKSIITCENCKFSTYITSTNTGEKVMHCERIGVHTKPNSYCNGAKRSISCAE